MSIGRAARYLVLGLALAAALGGAVVYSLLRRSVPASKGSVRLEGLDSPVEVFRDRWGVIHARHLHPSFYDEELMRPSKTGVEM